MIGGPDIVGQVAAREELTRLLASRRMPHALLFQGPEGVGKATLATALGTVLLCHAESVEACGKCPACVLSAAGNHPDFQVVRRLPAKKRSAATAASEPEDDGDDDAEAETAEPAPAAPAAAGGVKLASVISVDQIRDMCRLAGLAPRLGHGRVFVIDAADRMNANAQNALLKTLEEPPPGVTIVLVAARPSLLLPTVRSRCFSVRFAALRTPELASWLEQRGYGREEALQRASLAEGRPGRALTLDPAPLAAARDQLLAGLERLAAGPRGVSELPAIAASLAGKDEDDLIAGLELLEVLLRDAARAAVQGSVSDTALVHADLAPRLAALGRRIGATRIAELIQSIERLRRDLVFNLNRPLVAESLLAGLAGGPLP